MGRAFIVGERTAIDFYNDVYAAPLFGTVVIALLLFMVGGVIAGSAIAASARFPRWAGWIYAITVITFVLSNFFVPVGQSVAGALLFIATVAVAWSAAQEGRRQGRGLERPMEPQIQ